MAEKMVVILQPGYLPWLGFFEQLDRADIFVLYDNVQFDKNSWRNRNRIKTAYPVNGQNWQWLSVPVHVHGKPLIKDVLVDETSDWRKRHIAAIKQNYGRAEFFGDYFPDIERAIHEPVAQLAALDYFLIEMVASILGINAKIKLKLCSSLGINLPIGKTEKLITICQALGATKFYEAAAGAGYIDQEQFKKADIELEFQNYKHPSYRQLHGEFIPFLSAIDLLFNEGPRSLKIIRQGGRT